MAGFQQNGSLKKKLVFSSELSNNLPISLLWHMSDYTVIT